MDNDSEHFFIKKTHKNYDSENFFIKKNVKKNNMNNDSEHFFYQFFYRKTMFFFEIFGGQKRPPSPYGVGLGFTSKSALGTMATKFSRPL